MEPETKGECEGEGEGREGDGSNTKGEGERIAKSWLSHATSFRFILATRAALDAEERRLMNGNV